jgi:hypothetical protein
MTKQEMTDALDSVAVSLVAHAETAHASRKTELATAHRLVCEALAAIRDLNRGGYMNPETVVRGL